MGENTGNPDAVGAHSAARDDRAGGSDVSMPKSVDEGHKKIAAQAYVLIHGMGEQIPMDTIRGFAATSWSRNPDVLVPGMPHADQMWSKPDDRTGSLELRRITTRRGRASPSFPAGVRTDFYELYWADLTAGSTWDQFTAWVRYLLFRPWSKVPTNVRGAWLCLWVGAILVTALGLVALIPDTVWNAHVSAWLPQKLVIAFAAVVLAVMHRFAARTFGRVVRYTRADPDNIAARKAVRERGLALLRALHHDATYDRVVVVGHSLGTILAHDLISYFWAEQAAARTVQEGTPAFGAVTKVEAAAAALATDPTDASRAAFRAAQSEFGRLMRAHSGQAADPKARWLISDLVTLGSPLTHAEFLLANGADDLALRCRARELPTCPPYREELDPLVLKAAEAAKLLPPGDPKLMTFPEIIGSGTWSLHHAAPFAAVRWTNVYDPAHRIARGDMISGPLAKSFGEGISDIDLSKGDRPSTRFTHSRYWDPSQSAHRLATVRAALNIVDQ
ncbi:MAG: hypothetical protein NVSMB18_06480 [Acetobacteraceae bacterium]